MVGMTSGKRSLGLAVAAALLVLPRAGLADTRSDAAACFRQTANVTQDAQIAGCSRLIESGTADHNAVLKALYTRAALYAAKAKFDAAIEDMNRLLEMAPGNINALNDRGNTYLGAGNPKRAIEDYDEVLRRAPSHGIAYFNRARAYKQMSQYERSLQDFDQAVRLMPEHLSAILSRGDTYRNLGRYGEAMRDFERAIERERNPVFLVSRGLTWQHLGNYDRAAEDFDEAFRLAPDYPDASYSLGVIQYARGEFAPAAGSLATSAKLAPSTTTELLAYFARVRAGIGDSATLPKLAGSPEGKRWPGVVARLFLKQISERELRATPHDGVSYFAKPGQWECDVAFFLGSLPC
jgi:tetratricopeptide (TPR) repeat protein